MRSSASPSARARFLAPPLVRAGPWPANPTPDAIARARAGHGAKLGSPVAPGPVAPTATPKAETSSKAAARAAARRADHAAAQAKLAAAQAALDAMEAEFEEAAVSAVGGKRPRADSEDDAAMGGDGDDESGMASSVGVGADPPEAGNGPAVPDSEREDEAPEARRGSRNREATARRPEPKAKRGKTDAPALREEGDVFDSTQLRLLLGHASTLAKKVAAVSEPSLGLRALHAAATHRAGMAFPSLRDRPAFASNIAAADKELLGFERTFCGIIDIDRLEAEAAAPAPALPPMPPMPDMLAPGFEAALDEFTKLVRARRAALTTGAGAAKAEIVEAGEHAMAVRARLDRLIALHARVTATEDDSESE